MNWLKSKKSPRQRGGKNKKRVVKLEQLGCKKNKAKRFAKQQRSNVINALACVYCYCLRAELNGWRRKEELQSVVNRGGTAVKSEPQKVPNRVVLLHTVSTVQFFQTSVAIVIVCLAEMGRIPCCGRPESFSSDI